MTVDENIHCGAQKWVRDQNSAVNYFPFLFSSSLQPSDKGIPKRNTIAREKMTLVLSS